jgi:Na+/H+-dicarboxylate symporter
MAWFFGLPLWGRILIAMALGVALGFLLRPGSPLEGAVDLKGVTDGLKLLGDAFVRLIRMLAVPLIFVSVAASVVSIGDLSRLGKSGARVAGLYIPSGLLAAFLGVALATLLQPGAGVEAPVGIVPPEVKPPPTGADIVAMFIPGNPVKALADGEMLAVIVFAILLGIGILGAREEAKIVGDVLEAAAQALTKLVGYIMELAPLGAFALMAWAVALMGADALVKLAALIGTVYLGCAIYGVVVYGGFIKFALGLPVLPFFKGMSEAMAVAYSTSSSNATLPVTMKCMVERLGISRRMSAFVASLGATVNMDGTAMYMVIVTMFGAQLFGVDLGAPQIVGIVIAASLGAIGAAGIPGGSIVFIPLVLGIAGVPLEVIAIILGADRIMDMMRTVVNVLGDSAAAVAVAHWEGELDREHYLANTAPPATDAVAPAADRPAA